MYISEMFMSIQGEGNLAGSPAFFVRLGGCNLSCPGFGKEGCDSSFSVNNKHKEKWQKFTVDELFDTVKSKVPDTNTLIVLTGGEPTISKDFLEVGRLLDLVGYDVQIETNGTRFHIGDNSFCMRNFYVMCSPKLSNSGQALFERYKISIPSAPARTMYKFVVGDEGDIREVEAFMDYFDIDKKKVFLMPLGANRVELEKSSIVAWEAAIKLGVKYSDRLHIRVYDDKRGV